MKNRIVSIAILIGIFGLYYIFYIYGINIPCFFKSTFNISCPACGFTRAFRCIFECRFIEAFTYNILAIPIFIIVIISIVMLVYDFIFNKDTFVKSISKFVTNYYILILVALVISFLYNNFS